MTNVRRGSDETLIESLLEEGLFLFGADKVPAAVGVWQKVLELAPNEPRALDYLRAAGVEPGTKAPPNPRLVMPPRGSQQFSPLSTSGRIEAEEETPIPPPSWRPEPVVSHSLAPRASGLKLLLAVLAGAALALVAFLALSGTLSKKAVQAPAQTAADAPTESRAAELPPPATETLAATIPAEASPEATRQDYRVELRVEPADAEIRIDGELVAAGGFVKHLPIDGRTHELEVRAEGFKTQRMTFVDAAPPQLISLDRESSSKRRGQRRTTAGAKAETVPSKEPAATKPRASGPPTDNLDPWN